ncbi:MAG: hypothetical protein WBZ36_01360 [Candidatus Nitrosopolaris sp.]
MSGMHEESQNQLHSAEEELDRMKQYLNEVLEEVASFKMIFYISQLQNMRW